MFSFESSEAHYRYLIKLALNQKVSWIALKTFLKELISSFESSQQLNEVLLEELQLLHSQFANERQTESESIGIETEEQDMEAQNLADTRPIPLGQVTKDMVANCVKRKVQTVSMIL